MGPTNAAELAVYPAISPLIEQSCSRPPYLNPLPQWRGGEETQKFAPAQYVTVIVARSTYRFSAASMSATRVNFTRGRSTARPLATSSLSSRSQSSQEKQFG